MPGIGIYIAINKRKGGIWTPQSIASKLLYWGKVSEISGGRMANKVTGATDYITVGGSAGSYTFQVPNTAPYITADTDYIWFNTEAGQRTTTEAELIGYDLPRTPVKYDNTTPNAIREILILKAGQTLTSAELDSLHTYMELSIYWSGIWNDYGFPKENRNGQQLWIPEVFPVVENASVENAAKTVIEINFDSNLDEDFTPDVSAFVTSPSKTITNVDVTGAVVSLTVSVAFAYGDVITVSYTKPASNYLRSEDGTRVVSFTGQDVTNNIANPYGNEVIANGTFDSGLKWTAAGGWSISDGRANYNDVTNASSLKQIYTDNLINIKLSTNYKLEFDIIDYPLRLYVLDSSGDTPYILSTVYAVGHHTLTFTTPSGSAHRGISFYAYTADSGAGKLDNVSLKEIL